MRWKEFKKKRGIYVTILIFVILSALLMTVGTIVILRTSGSMNAIFEIAKPPHFLQMHTGDIDQKAIDEFTNSVDYVKEQETIEMLNIDAASIWYEKSGKTAISMSENMMDNGFVKQTKKFDYLLDENSEVIAQTDGKISVPISYKSKYDLKVGDKVIISQGQFYREYEINHFVRDAQMASTMASSVRFLVSDSDYKELKSQIGELEYLIEFRLKNSSDAMKFQKLYEATESNMPKEGQGITYPLIKLVNALSGGLLAGMMIVISLLLILIASFVLKFTILAALEEEIYEIGVMKAIGIPTKEIQKQYLLKYKVLAVVGCVTGYLAGIGCSSLFTKEIETMFGQQGVHILEFLLPILTVLFVYLRIVHNTKKVLKRLRKITVVQALVYGETGEKRRKEKAQSLPLKKHCGHDANAYLAFKELLTEKRMWLLIVFTFFLAINVILNPLNLVHTFQSPKFSEYMGNAPSDVRVIIQAKDSVEEKCQSILTEIDNDHRITSKAVYSLKKYEVLGTEEKNIWIESGDYSEFSADCMEGRMPKKDHEIAISYLNKEELEKGLGETISIVEDSKKVEYTICGIYQDITSGGFTAKAYSHTRKADAQSYMVLFNCQDKSQISEIAKEYDKKYEYAKVLPMEVYCEQTFGSVVDSFAKGIVMIAAVAGMIVVLIMFLFLKLQGAKKIKEIIMLHVMGFGRKDLLKQYLIKSIAASVLGIALGIVFANTLGASLIGFGLSFTGLTIAKFHYIANPLSNVVLCPILLLILAVVIVYCFIRSIVSNNKLDIRNMQD